MKDKKLRIDLRVFAGFLENIVGGTNKIGGLDRLDQEIRNLELKQDAGSSLA